MTLTPREIVLSLVTGGMVLVGVTAVVGRSHIDDWRVLRTQRKNVEQLVVRQKRLIANRATKEEELTRLSKMLPHYAGDKKLRVHWLSVMNQKASKNGVTIIKHQPGKEQRDGDVYLLPIQCTQWKGSLEGIVGFLFDLQKEGAMLDVQELRINRPKRRRSKEWALTGRFILHCAYTRESRSESGEAK